MKKISKKFWLATLVGIAILAFAGLGMGYSYQGREQGRLNQELEQAQLILKNAGSNLSSEKQQLEQKLSQTNSEIGSLKKQLTANVESIEVVDYLFFVAERTGMVVLNVSVSSPQTIKLNNINYRMSSVAVRLQGIMPDLLDFINKWCDENRTSVIESVQSAMTESSSDNSTDNATVTDQGQIMPERGIIVATLKLVVYSYAGD